jgi:hypothetical protein
MSEEPSNIQQPRSSNAWPPWALASHVVCGASDKSFDIIVRCGGADPKIVPLRNRPIELKAVPLIYYPRLSLRLRIDPPIDLREEGIDARLVAVSCSLVRPLAMVAEVVHGAPYRFKDPARFALAHGGKDGQPFPVPLHVYDRTIQVLKSAVQNAKLGRDEELSALRRLDEQARVLERYASGPTLEQFIAQERESSHRYGGRSIFGEAEHVTRISDPEVYANAKAGRRS